MEKSLICGVLLSLIVLSNCYPQGAPVRPESCQALQPIHRDRVTQQQIPNQQGQAPYRVFISQPQYVPCQMAQQCRQYPITGQPTPFRGFIIQARTPSRGNRAVGTFIPSTSQDSKILQCTNGLTLTHTNNLDKQEVRFQWIPEPGLREQVQFVVRNGIN
ncbi:hypothetical protein KUTeg_008647 [Tegillarca granosa]|uniref:Reelin domain-containing protein n=1 Tax=Tegillarca granosa TaxID=220873 RepID=A0ABQ9FBV3_TEGGR|nr:hypothetical protein KUTeg_008647 [Tegillarca granosa]